MLESVIVYFLTTVLGLLIGLVGKLVLDAVNQRHATKSLLRSEMVRVYYKYRESKKIPHYIKEAWYDNYTSYKKLKGNSFIDDLKHDIDEWEVE